MSEIWRRPRRVRNMKRILEGKPERGCGLLLFCLAFVALTGFWCLVIVALR